jgi:hypothetical protein
MASSAQKEESRRLHQRHREFLLMESTLRQADVEFAVARIRSGELVKKLRRK